MKEAGRESEIRPLPGASNDDKFPEPPPAKEIGIAAHGLKEKDRRVNTISPSDLPRV